MTELDLYKFVSDNEIEYHWHDDNVIIFVSVWRIEQWSKLLGHGIMDEEGIECRMKYNYFCFWMKDICGYFGIELSNVFKNEQE